jgi:hypothetical protein
VKADRLTFYRRNARKPSPALDLVAVSCERLAQVISDDHVSAWEDTVVGKKADSNPLLVLPLNQKVAVVPVSGSSQDAAQ